MVLDVLLQAIESNLAQVLLMEIVVAFLYILNISMGTLLGSIKEGFDLKKLFFGVLKGLGILVVIFGTCYTLNLFMIVLNLIDGLEINVDIVTPIQILAILVTQGVDLSKDIYEKISSIRELKYIKAEDIRTIDYNVATEDKG